MMLTRYLVNLDIISTKQRPGKCCRGLDYGVVNQSLFIKNKVGSKPYKSLFYNIRSNSSVASNQRMMLRIPPISKKCLNL